MLYLEQLKPEVRPFYYMIWDLVILIVTWKWCELKGASQVALVVKKRPANAGDVRRCKVRTLGREDSPGGGYGNPL